MQRYIAAYYEWKKDRFPPPRQPVNFELMQFDALMHAERLFYRTGVSPQEALQHLDAQLERQREMAKWIEAHIDSVVLGRPELVTSAGYLTGVDPAQRELDPAVIAAQAAVAPDLGPAQWSFDPLLLWRVFHSDETSVTDERQMRRA